MAWQQEIFISAIVAALVTLFVWVATGRPKAQGPRSKAGSSAGPNYAVIFVVVLLLAYVLFFVMSSPTDKEADEGLERALQHVLRAQDLDF